MVSTRISYAGFLLCVALLGLTSTGCMISPQHGEDVGRIDNLIAFYGATTLPRQRLEIQALNPMGGWERISDATTVDVATELESGTWYIWGNLFVRIPRRYWRDAGAGRMSAIVRTRVLEGDVLGSPALLTFENGFEPNDYSDVSTMWDEYGHGRSVTVYGRL